MLRISILLGMALAGIACLVLACDTATPAEEAAETSTPDTSAAIDTSCYHSCSAQTPGSYEISAACSECMRKNFADEGYQFPKYHDQPVRGFRIAQDELREILNDIGSDSTAQVYAMLAIRDSFDSRNNEVVPIPELVFVMSQTDSAGTNYTYYDFTKPCPDWCPDDM